MAYTAHAMWHLLGLEVVRCCSYKFYANTCNELKECKKQKEEDMAPFMSKLKKTNNN